MRYEKLTNLSNNEFKRLTGVSKNIFGKMTQILKEAQASSRKYRGGTKAVFSMEDKLLMTLEYWREYRTYFHIAKSYGASEGHAFKCIRFVEDTLIKHKDFALPGRKALLSAKPEDVALIDVSESPIERPKKKSESLLLRQEKTSHHKDSIGG